MIRKSVKNQLNILSTLFTIFILVVIFQMVFIYSLQKKENDFLETGQHIITQYISLEENERIFIEELYHFTTLETSAIQDTELNSLKTQMIKHSENITNWLKTVNSLNKEHNIFNSNEEKFLGEFENTKKRNIKEYKQALELCIKRNLQAVKTILNIETNYKTSVQQTTDILANSINTKLAQIKQNNRTIYITIYAIVISVISILLYYSYQTIKIIISNLRILKTGTARISQEDYSKDIFIDSPVEFADVANAFNEMQNIIKLRGEKIKEHSDSLKKLNENLEQKVIERNLTISQKNTALQKKNEELEQILYTASHDLRTPLIGIQGFSEELKFSCDELLDLIQNPKNPEVDISQIKELIDDEIISSLNFILNGSKRMGVLLEGLLRLSRLGKQSLQINKLDMNGLMKSIIDSLTYQMNENDIDVTVENLEPCDADRSQMEQIFINLISNAIKYRSEQRKCKIEIYSKSTTATVSYFVKDNGIGIPKRNLKDVFHAFFRINEDTTVQGDGIGLAVVNRAMSLHSGHVYVESKEGKGSSFIIELPKPIDVS